MYISPIRGNSTEWTGVQKLLNLSYQKVTVTQAQKHMASSRSNNDTESSRCRHRQPKGLGVSAPMVACLHCALHATCRYYLPIHTAVCITSDSLAMSLDMLSIILECSANAVTRTGLLSGYWIGGYPGTENFKAGLKKQAQDCWAGPQMQDHVRPSDRRRRPGAACMRLEESENRNKDRRAAVLWCRIRAGPRRRVAATGLTGRNLGDGGGAADPLRLVRFERGPKGKVEGHGRAVGHFGTTAGEELPQKSLVCLKHREMPAVCRLVGVAETRARSATELGRHPKQAGVVFRRHVWSSFNIFSHVLWLHEGILSDLLGTKNARNVTSVSLAFDPDHYNLHGQAHLLASNPFFVDFGDLSGSIRGLVETSLPGSADADADRAWWWGDDGFRDLSAVRVANRKGSPEAVVLLRPPSSRHAGLPLLVVTLHVLWMLSSVESSVHFIRLSVHNGTSNFLLLVSSWSLMPAGVTTEE
ncbi:hypothetical protein V8F20_001193 [Naviculisporaceae sp. PSN 640]